MTDYRQAVLDALEGRSNICPSEVARGLAGDWRPLMEPVRQAARALVAEGLVEITQGGHPVDPENFKGPIRLRRKKP